MCFYGDGIYVFIFSLCMWQLPILPRRHGVLEPYFISPAAQCTEFITS